MKKFFENAYKRLWNLKTTVPGAIVFIFTICAAFGWIPGVDIQTGADSVNEIVTGLLALCAGGGGLAAIFSKDPKITEDSDG